MVKNLPAMQETGVQSLGQEDTMEKGMAFPPAHSVPFLCPPATPEQRNSIEPSGLQGVALGFRQREADPPTSTRVVDLYLFHVLGFSEYFL